MRLYPSFLGHKFPTVRPVESQDVSWTERTGFLSVADIKAILSHAQPMLGRLGAGRGTAVPAAREPQRPSARPH